MSLLLFIATIGLLGLTGVALVAWKLRGRNVSDLLVTAGIALGAWGAAYATLLVGTSLTSKPRVLSYGETKRYCGFYLDCHLHSAVVGVDSLRLIRTATAELTAGGLFFIVTVEVSSDARRAPIHFVDPRAVVRAADGRAFARSDMAERALAASGSPSTPIESVVNAGESFRTTLVFDVPADAKGLVLDLTDGYGIDRAIELLLVGDDDSLLHARTVSRVAR
ncbi:MAG TPA: hypothetical protein VE967_15310 [Gemmatimonadaceae bacterium]|nr:hypothetical protein [Gemmatimonadaceae bacterium]